MKRNTRGTSYIMERGDSSRRKGKHKHSWAVQPAEGKRDLTDQGASSSRGLRPPQLPLGAASTFAGWQLGAREW